MAELKYKAPKGTKDILPREAKLWQTIRSTLTKTASTFGFEEINVPIFEHTELFVRSVGDTTDVVQKEMYTFMDKGDRSVTLRPEWTAGVVRSCLENGLVHGSLPVKVSYFGPCFRYEKPQAGRLRQFHQFGVEMFGAPSPMADAQVILLARSCLSSLGIEHVSLHINSIGCPKCRSVYNDALRKYFEEYKDRLCDTCLDRLEKNPMRIIDCKSPECQSTIKDAPRMIDYLCEDCREHFDTVQSVLRAENISFEIDTSIVRGLDYYTRTVFEFVSSAAGAQGTVCGGGRYDGMMEQMGGPAMAGIGFAMGIERLIMVMIAEKSEIPENEKCDFYAASLGKDGSYMAFKIASLLRDEGFSSDSDVVGRGLKAQMKYADKIGARFCAVLGDDEVKTGNFVIKNMHTGVQTEVTSDTLIETFYRLSSEDAVSDLTDKLEGGLF